MKAAASKEDVKLKTEQTSLCLPRKILSHIIATTFVETVDRDNNSWLVVSEACQSALSEPAWLQICLFLKASY